MDAAKPVMERKTPKGGDINIKMIDIQSFDINIDNTIKKFEFGKSENKRDIIFKISDINNKLSDHYYLLASNIDNFFNLNIIFKLYQTIDEIYTFLLDIFKENKYSILLEQNSIKLLLKCQMPGGKNIEIVLTLDKYIIKKEDLKKNLFTVVEELLKENEKIKEEIKNKGEEISIIKNELKIKNVEFDKNKNIENDEIKNELKNKDEEINKIKNEFKSKNDEFNEIKKEIISIKNELKNKDEEINKIKNDFKSKDEEINKIKNVIKNKDEEIKKIKNEFKNKDEEIKKIKNEFKNKDDEFNKIKNEFKNKDDEFNKIKNEFKIKDDEFNKIKNVIKNKDDELNKIKNVIKNKDDEFNKIKNDFKNKDEEIHKIKNELKSKDEEINKIKNDFRNKTEEINKIKDDFRNKDDEFNKIKNELKSKDEEINTIKNAFKNKDEEIKKIKNDFKSKDEEIIKIKKELKGKDEKIILIKNELKSKDEEIILIKNELIIKSENIVKMNNDLKKVKEENNNIKSKIINIDNLVKKQIQNEQNNKSFLGKSNIIKDNEEKNKIKEWISSNGNIKSTNLLYRATEHGDTSESFFNRCANKGPTISFIKTKKGKRFGGYSNVEWINNMGDVKLYDNTAFLFSLDNLKKYNILKPENAIFCLPNQCCLVYGHNGDGKGLYLYSGFLDEFGYENHSSKVYNTSTDFCLSGESQFKVEEVEVFQIIYDELPFNEDN